MKVEAPERIWIESDGGCPYFYLEKELADVSPPITEYVRADKLEELAAENEALRAEGERLHRILGRIVEGDSDSTLTIRAGADAFAAAREYLPVPHNRKRIAWKLERTAMGDGYYGEALCAAKELPEATPSVRALLDRWITGKQYGLTDRTDLCTFALQIYMSDLEREDDNE